MARSPEQSDWQQILDDLRELEASLTRGMQRLEAPQGDEAEDTHPSSGGSTLEGFVHLAKAKALADRIALLLKRSLDRIGDAAFARRDAPADRSERTYSIRQLTEIIAQMINTAQSRRAYTYVPPYDIEKTLRALVKLQREQKEHIEIREDDESESANV